MRFSGLLTQVDLIIADSIVTDAHRDARIDYVCGILHDPRAIRSLSCIPCSSRAAGCATDYPLVIYHETESFDDFIRTLGSLEMPNSNVHEHWTLSVWNLPMEILARKRYIIFYIKDFINNTNIYYFLMNIYSFDSGAMNIFERNSVID